MQANGSWPQIPNDFIVSDSKTYAKMWVAALAPYGIPHETWLCSTIQRSIGLPASEINKPENYRVTTSACSFDDKPSSPYPEEPYPWFVEKAGFHGSGNLLILVQRLDDVVEGAEQVATESKQPCFRSRAPSTARAHPFENRAGKTGGK